MNAKILLAGIGGQGVLFAHQLLADCAVAMAQNVTGAETHGMSQRGGAIVSHLKIGDTLAPLIHQGTADFLLAFDAAESYRSFHFVRRGGTAVVNSGQADYPDPRVRERLAALGITLYRCDADAIARSLGRVTAANVALIGFASTLESFPLPTSTLKETLTRLVPDKFRELNLQAFDQGVNWRVEVRD